MELILYWQLLIKSTIASYIKMMCTKLGILTKIEMVNIGEKIIAHLIMCMTIFLLMP